ncbi:alpha-2-macroglobulin, partial [Candidatus Bipolaricaulota bacterium]|nr:alpha-2-macroglobulin [Candidatus Bipolaricaulota bacterium]
VVTAADGHATVALDLPDNLTTWVARAVGVTVDTEVGEGVAELLVTKPLLVRPVAPRFLVVGDRVRLAAIVSNQTTADQTVDVTIGQTGLALEDPAVQRILVRAGGEETVTWWTTVRDVPSVDLAFSAVAGDLEDAARPRLTTGPDGTLLVYRYTAPETVGTAGQLATEGSRTELILLPPDADIERSELIVRLETSLAAAMQQGLNYLEHFEYECTEQVVSRFLPNILTYRALERLGIENPELAERLPALAAEGMEKLYVRQNGDGGWGWWEHNPSSAYLTAYAVLALLHADEAGFPVNGDVLARGLDFLEDSIVKASDLASFSQANRQAWLLYVLTFGGRGENVAKHADALYEERAKLSHYARAYLAMTLDRLNAPGARVDTLVSDLYNAAILSSTGAHWEEPDYDWWAMNTDTRSTAIILDALVQLDPTQPLLPNVVRWLMVARKGGIWETTQETAWALIALTDWMLATGELAGTYDVTASLNGNVIFSGTAGADETGVPDPITLTLEGDRLTTGVANELSIARGEGDGRLYYTAHLNVQLPVEDVEALSRGIIVQRQYVDPECPSDGICTSVLSAAVGDTILVRLTIIAPHDLYYVVLEDPYPAGCEAIDTTLATSSLSDPDPGLFRQADSGGSSWFYWWWWRWFSRSELRDEKLVLFADYLPAGTYTYQYSLRATTPGEFRVLPTSAHEFYFPEVFGRTDGELFVVEAAD